jgi:hypothetical protein
MWGLRLTLGVILLTMSEIVMWQNPPARSLIEWPLRLLSYVALAALLLDFIVRYQVRGPATLLFVSCGYALLHSAVLNPAVFANFPVTLVVRGFGLQVAAAVYGVLLFLIVMRGKQPNGWQVLGAVGIGLIWGIWLHWYPLQTSVNWGEVPLATGQSYVLVCLAIIGGMFWVISPRLRVVREGEFYLRWWERVVVVVPLFVTLVVGMIQGQIPFLPLLLIIALIAFVGWALNWQRGGYEPSFLAQMTFSAPNLIAYVVFVLIFLAVSTLSYGLITDAESIVGIVTYYLILIFGSLALPGASLLLFLRFYTERNAQSVMDDDADADEQAGA